MNDDNNGIPHWLRQLTKSLQSIEGLIGEMVLVETDRNEILRSIAASLASLDSKTPALPAITADGETMKTSQKGPAS